MQDGQNSASDLQELLQIAVGAVRHAGNFLKESSHSDVIVAEDLDRDVKLIVDRGSENIIIRELDKKSSLSILSEERGSVSQQNSIPGLQWIVDPLDGSLNYLHGIPLCCVSVGLWCDAEPLLGVIYDFNREELFTGIVGIGAWLNNDPINVSRTHKLQQSVLCTGFPVATDFSTNALLQFVGQIRQYKKIRLLGSAALSLAYVAAGRADAYFERDIKVWDIAAGLAIVRAGGGKFIQTTRSSAHAVTTYASNFSLPEPDFVL
ncbi:MAG: inositol monophosphatase [Desulfobacterales bacterium]|nr:inositol monophosphatase [Desulfobacterales bacterium]